MLRLRRFFLLGLVFVVAFVIALIVTWPARVAYRLVSLPPTVVVCQGIHGTVWSGYARSCRLDGRFDGRLQWSVATDPSGLWDLLRFAPSVRLGWNGPGVRLTGTVVLSRPLRAHGLEGHVSLALLGRVVPSLSLLGRPEGKLVLHRLDFDVGPGHLGPIRGSARILDARFGGPPSVAFGDIVFKAVRHGTQSLITARSLHARTLALDARLLLDPRGTYRLTARLAALAGAPQALVSYVDTLPPGPRPNTHLLRSAGRVDPAALLR
jgi:hypothetical protein